MSKIPRNPLGLMLRDLLLLSYTSQEQTHRSQNGKLSLILRSKKSEIILPKFCIFHQKLLSMH